MTDPVAYLWTNVQSGFTDVSLDEDCYDRESGMWHCAPQWRFGARHDSATA